MHYLKNAKNLVELQKQDTNRLLDQKLSYSNISNALIVPHIGCFDSNRNFIDGTWLHETRIFPFKESYAENTIHIKKAVYIGCLASIWGHCITDGLKRLWFLFSEFLENNKDVSFLYTTVNDLPLPENFKRILKYLIPNNIELQEITNNTIVNDLYIPDVSFFSSSDGKKYYYKEFNFVLDLLKKRYTKPEQFMVYDKIYLSRTAIKSNREFGEIYIENVFKNAGFTIIHPEKFSLEEQLYLYQNCKYLATLEGSGAHNSLFCNQNTKVSIIRKSDFINPYQITIDKISGVDEIYIDSNFSILNSKSKQWEGPFFLYISKQLGLFFKDTFNIKLKTHFPYITFIKYIFISSFNKFKHKIKNLFLH